jgi:chromate transport protein ChrA
MNETSPPTELSPPATYTLWQLVRYMLELGTWASAVGAAVIGIIATSAYKLTTKNIGKDKLLWAIFLLSAAMTVITKSEIVWILLGDGVPVWLLRALPKSWFGGSVNIH